MKWPAFRSVRSRTMLATALIVIAAVGSIVVINIRREQRRIIAGKEDEARAFASALASVATVNLIEHNWGSIDFALRYATKQNEDFVYAIVSDAAARDMMVAALPLELDMHYVPDLVRREVTERATSPFRGLRTQQTVLVRDVMGVDGVQRGSAGDDIVEVDHALVNDLGERIGTLRIGVSLRAVEVATRHSLEVGALTGAIALFFALLVAYILATRLTRPIEALSARLRSVGSGDLEADAPVRGNDEIADLTRSFNAMLTGLRQKRMLEKYVPKGARDDIEKKQSGKVALGGARVRKAILFSDLRGFTSTSERLEPDQVVRLLNRYLESMTRVILAHGGDINEYIGDAILAVFARAEDAVAAAVEMQAALDEVRKTTDDEEVRALRMGIGIHVGDVVEGNIGTDERVKFGVVGDTVNLAARIQDRSRDGKHTCILVSEAVESDTKPSFAYELVGDVAMKGKAAPVRVFEVIGRLA